MVYRDDWQNYVFSDAIQINPRETLSKGTICKKVGMVDIQEKEKNIKNYCLEEYKSGAKFRQGDTLFARITPCLENGKISKVNILEDDEIGFGSTEFIVMRSRPGITDSEFVYYLSLWEEVREPAIKSMTGTSGRQRVQNSIFDQLIIKLPRLDEQVNIGYFLSLFDKKIETNNAIIANLEAQAQAIFKSRFVDFEPFQDGQFVESELGMIPEGWEVGKLGNSSLGKLLSSGINDFENQKIYLATADVTDSNITNYETKITMEDKPSRANMQPIKNSVWFAKMKDSRKLIYVGANDDFLVDEVIFSTGFAGIKAVESSVHYLWTYLLTEDFNTKKNLLSNGTTMQAINNTNINRIKIVIPKNNVLEDFNGLVKPMFELISSYKNQNLKLAQIRDTLLPKLMSGEIRVGQDDIEEIENLL